MTDKKLLGTHMSAQILALVSSFRLHVWCLLVFASVLILSLLGMSRFFMEFLYFGIKGSTCLPVCRLVFCCGNLCSPRGIWGVPRYDVLLLVALAIQVWMVRTKLETVDELKAITIFHVVGFALEVFKTSSGIKSWSYPDFAYTKLFGVPCFLDLCMLPRL